MPAARGRLETGDEDRAGPDAARIVPFEKAQELVAPEIRKERDALQQENATRRQRPKRLADRFGAPLSFLPKDLPERGMRRSEGAEDSRHVHTGDILAGDRPREAPSFPQEDDFPAHPFLPPLDELSCLEILEIDGVGRVRRQRLFVSADRGVPVAERELRQIRDRETRR